MRHDLPRRAFACFALALFLLGGNFCFFAVTPALASGLATAAADDAPAAHGCCAKNAARSARETDATREKTAPCCVAIAPIVGAHDVSLDAAPAMLAAALPPSLDLFIAVSAGPSLAVAEDARPPDRVSATPDAGRAPPRL